MSMERIRAGLTAAVVIVASASAGAQPGTGFTISDADTFFTQGASPSGPTGPTGTGAAGAAMRVSGAMTTDHLFQHWWWYRINGVDTREFAFANAVGTTASGNMAVTNWTYPSFTAEATYVVQDAGSAAGLVRETMRITNTTAQPISISIYSYTDFDLLGTPAGDSAMLAAGPQTIRVTDGATFSEVECLTADAYFVAVFSAVRTALADADIDNLNNTGLPFGPADFTGAFEWTVTIEPGASRDFMQELRVNVAGRFGACCMADDACVFLNPRRCEELGGAYRGDGIACAPGVCSPLPTGACCMNACACLVMTQADCDTAGGTYRGDETACDASACFPDPACVCNWNGDAFLNSQDLFDFLTDLFESRADYNCDTFVNSQDFFDFTACLFAPPTGCP